MAGDIAWKALSWTAAVGAAWAGRKAATALWSEVAETEPPVNPADRSVSWAEAAGWATIAGLTAAVARVLARRGAAAAWEGVTGEQPPELNTA